MDKAEFDQYILPVYTRFPITITRGEGVYIYDDEGRKYLDFMSGWGVSNLGHRPEPVIKAITRQAQELIHAPNVFYFEPQGRLAELLVRNSIDGQVFFCNSGSEANEAAIKFAKLYGKGEKHKIIAAERSFHGRTTAAMAATNQGAVRDGFEPHLQGFVHVPLNDVAALEAAADSDTLAIILEMVQGEGGIHIASKEYVAAVAKLQANKDILVIVDEVQTGMGRTGPLFAYQNYDLEPDIITCAKSLASGLPIGATVVGRKVAASVRPGVHGSTFGGGSLVATAAIATLQMLTRPEVRKNAKELADVLAKELSGLKERHADIKEIRQQGLMIGIELDHSSKPVAEACLEKGLFVNSTQGTVIRLLPPLIAGEAEAKQAVSIIDEVLSEQP